MANKTATKAAGNKVESKAVTAATTKVIPKAIAPDTKQMNLPVPMKTDKQIQAAAKKQLDDARKIICREMTSVEKSFIHIGYALHSVRENAIFKKKDAPYKNVYDFAKSEFGIARGTCNGWIQLIEKFGKRSADGKLLDDLDEKYSAYKSSQLLVMIGLSDDQLAEVTPETSVRDMKSIKKGKDSRGEDGEQIVIDVDCTEIVRNVVMMLDSTIFNDLPVDSDKKHIIAQLINEKVNIITKLLLSGHKVVMYDEHEQYADVKGDKKNDSK